jgi:D-3-phosphoglycerate dehydrogenase
VNVIIFDDYHDTLRTLPWFAELADHKVMIWNDHEQHVEPIGGNQ